MLDQVTMMRTGDTPSGNGKQIIRYAYDRFGNVTTTTDARGAVETGQYDKTGRLQMKTDRNGNQIRYQYDAMSRVIKESVTTETADGVVISEREYGYNRTGNKMRELSRETISNSRPVVLESRYYYNNKGQLIRQEDPEAAVKEYTYDIHGNRQSFRLMRTGQAAADSNLYYRYDTRNRLIEVRKDGASGTVLAAYEYDKKSNRTVMRNPQAGIETWYQYNYNNQMIVLESKRYGAVISSWRHVYGVDGNLLSKTDQASSPAITITYQYDGLGRLTEENYPAWKRTLYTYDPYSNRIKMMVEGKTKNEPVSVTSYQYDNNNRLELETKKQGKVTELHRYCYDANGNETFRIWERTGPRPDYPGSVKLSGDWKHKTPTVYEWRHYNGFNQLIKINQDEQEIEYQYRGDGLRHNRKVRKLTESQGKTTVFYWDGDDIVAEKVNGEKKKNYLRGNGLIAKESDHVVYYYILNFHGDVEQLWNMNGTRKALYEYDAFGNEKDLNEKDENPFRYCGEYFDVETETVYLRNRDYRASTGRFTSQDPINAGLNWYTYCNNNPVLFSDPLGLYQVYDPHTRAYVDIADPIEASKYASTPYEKLTILAESQGWNVPDGMSLQDYYYTQVSPLYNGVSMAQATNHDDYEYWHPLPEHQTLYWQGVEFGKGERATVQVLASALSMPIKEPKLSPEQSYSEYAGNATRNASSSEVVLGKYNQDGISYVEVANQRGATYFQLDNWDDIVASVGEKNIWNINQEFLTQQMHQGKSFILSHDPLNATGFYAQEINFLQSNGYGFIRQGAIWKAVK